MTSFRFKALEYHYRHKASDWYWAVGIVTIAAATTAIIFNNILFGILIILGGFSLIIHAARPPRERDIEIGEAGITINEYRFSYSNLESFWLEHNEFPRLLIKTNRTLMPHIVIPVSHLDESERAEIREFLRTKLLELEQHEPVFEMIMEYIGF